MKKYTSAFTILESMVVVGVIGLLMAIAIPNFIRNRDTARAKLCLNNKRLIGHAVEQYMIQNNIDDADGISLDVVTDYIKGGVPECPSEPADDDDDYSIGAGTGGGVLVSCAADPTHVPPYDTGAV